MPEEMPAVEKQIDVEVPVGEAYAEWTRFEQFPRFMEGVSEVRQLDDVHLHWRARLDGVECEWDAEVTELRPDERIVWRATGGAANAGVVSFHRLDDRTTRITMWADVENSEAADALGRRVQGDLERFKQLAEAA
jgi:uncharacterized membrane protein